MINNRNYRKLKEYFPYLVLLAGILGLFWLMGSQNTASGRIIATQGIHWHSRLLITVNGVSEEIPADIGLETAIHNPIHTHDEDAKDGVIHMEFSGLVTEDNLKLKNFFKVWKKQFTELCIFDNCSEAPGKVTMEVNNRPDDSFGEYSMKDDDIIEISFTK